MNVDRFWDHVGRGAEDACWEWLGASTGRGGYGRTWTGARAHRVAYELAVGPIPDGLAVCHTCDNPPCCNPAHLRVGTQAENLAEMRERGRAKAPPPHGQAARGERHGMAKLTDAEVKSIRKRHARGVAKKALARRFGVSPTQIRNIVNGRSRVA